jgi:hypothetical protein
MNSKNTIITAITIIIIAAVTFFGYKIYHRMQLGESVGRGAGSGQSDHEQEGQIPQSGDLCGGTGGIGQIISIGNNTFTLKRKDGRRLIVNLTAQRTIKTATGSGSLSDLKPGDRVTLVGGPNPDGSFTATTVLLCK